MKLTAEQLEALAAGATYEDALELGDTKAEDELLGLLEEAEVEGESEASEDVEVEASAEGEEVDALQAKLAELEAKNVELGEQLAAQEQDFTEQLAAKDTALKAQSETTNKIAAVLRPYVDRMATALNQAVDATSAEQVLEAHSKLQPAFAKAYKSGRQSVATASATSSEKLNKQDADMLYRAKSFNL